MIEALRNEVCRVNRLLPATGLVTMHSGNASGYDPEQGRVVIKPSGVDYDSLTPEM
ncbi:MAG: L-ribulose-5-phosphate 4-epimerase, partial [Phycisphaerae bacterium]|nr:L-ribulose-5-phosphate 4-epimerase [Phycisphaerae bacterium]